MTVFDLLFLVLALVAIGTLIRAGYAALRGRRARATRLLRRLGIGAAVYFAVLVLVSAATPQPVRQAGDDLCSDDWCIAALSMRQQPSPLGRQYEVTLRLSSRAKRVGQRERFVAVHLHDADGRDYAPVARAEDVPFDTLLLAGQTVVATRQFIVPADARVGGVVVSRDGVGRIPGCCIIGDENSFFHRRTIIAMH